MKKFKLSFALLIIFFGFSGYSQIWEKSYGQVNVRELSRDIIETYDHGYLVLGWVDGYSGWLIKTNINGDTLWEKVLLNSYGQLTPWSLAQTPDNGFIVAGGCVSEISNTNNPFLLKLNACGEKEWCVSLFHNNVSYALDILIEENGNIIILTTGMGDIFNERIHLYCFDENGLYQWHNSYATNDDYPLLESPTGMHLFSTDEGGYMIVGDGYHPKEDEPNGLKPLRALFIKVSSEGEEEWVLPFGIDSYLLSTGNVVIENNNGYYTGFGSHYTDSLNPMIMNFDYLGNQIDYHILEADTLFNNCFDYYFSNYAEQMENGNYFLCVPHNYENLALGNWGQVILDEDYNVLTSFNQLNSFSPISMKKTSDNKYIQASKTPEGENPYISDIYLSKINENLIYDSIYTEPYEYDYECNHPIESGFITFNNCNIIVGTEEVPTPKEYLELKQKVIIQIAPNPALEEIKLSFENTEKHLQLDLRITSILGQHVYKIALIKGQIGVTIPLSNWQQGVYLVQVYSNGKLIGNNRFIKM